LVVKGETGGQSDLRSCCAEVRRTRITTIDCSKIIPWHFRLTISTPRPCQPRAAGADGRVDSR